LDFLMASRSLLLVVAAGFVIGAAVNAARTKQTARGLERPSGDQDRVRLRIPPSHYYYMVSLQHEGKHICGGTLISPRHILTSAYCVKGKSATELQAGIGPGVDDDIKFGQELKYFQVDKVEVHEGYTARENGNDLAVLTLTVARPLPSHPGNHIKLPKAGEKVAPQTQLTTMGWGATEESDPTSAVMSAPLMEVELNTISNADCTRRAGVDIPANRLCIDASHGKGVCHGDEGGPLVRAGDKILIGVTSYFPKGCVGPDGFNIFTSVVEFLPWINTRIAA